MVNASGIVFGIFLVFIAVGLITFVTIPSATSTVEDIVDQAENIAEGKDVGANVVGAGVNIFIVYIVGYVGTVFSIILGVIGVVVIIKSI